MSQPGSKRKNAPGIFDVLMFVSCAAVITGIIFLVLALGSYDWSMPG